MTTQVDETEYLELCWPEIAARIEAIREEKASAGLKRAKLEPYWMRAHRADPTCVACGGGWRIVRKVVDDDE